MFLALPSWWLPSSPSSQTWGMTHLHLARCQVNCIHFCICSEVTLPKPKQTCWWTSDQLQMNIHHQLSWHFRRWCAYIRIPHYEQSMHSVHDPLSDSSLRKEGDGEGSAVSLHMKRWSVKCKVIYCVTKDSNDATSFTSTTTTEPMPPQITYCTYMGEG